MSWQPSRQAAARIFHLCRGSGTLSHPGAGRQRWVKNKSIKDRHASKLETWQRLRTGNTQGGGEREKRRTGSKGNVVPTYVVPTSAGKAEEIETKQTWNTTTLSEFRRRTGGNEAGGCRARWYIIVISIYRGSRITKSSKPALVTEEEAGKDRRGKCEGEMEEGRGGKREGEEKKVNH